MIKVIDESNFEKQLLRARPAVERLPGGKDLFQIVCFKAFKNRNDRDWDNCQFGFIRKVARHSSIDIHRHAERREKIWNQSDSVDTATESTDDCPVQAML